MNQIVHPDAMQRPSGHAPIYSEVLPSQRARSGVTESLG
jgi:hypothetical protein